MKEFRIAQIVPVGQLEETKENQYHMCLAHLIGDTGQRAKYKQFYKEMAINPNKFVLMDNGAAEDEQVSNKTLVRRYEEICPDEIVLPDVLFDGQATVRKTKAFIREFGNLLTCRLMVVPQGHNLEEWYECLKRLLEIDRVSTIGVSKFLNIKTKDPFIRKKALQLINRTDCDNIEVHLLGCDEGPKIVGEIAMEYPIVRGCDSAYAYIATKAEKTICSNIERPREVEIDFLDDKKLSEYKENAKRFEKIAGVIDNGETKTWLK